MIFKNFKRNLKLNEAIDDFKMDSFNTLLYKIEKDCIYYLKDPNDMLTEFIVKYKEHIISQTYVFRSSLKSKYEITDNDRPITIHFINILKEGFYACYCKEFDDIYKDGFMKDYFEYLNIRRKLEKIQNKKSTNI